MSLQTPPMQVYPFDSNNNDDEIEDVGIIELHRSDSSVYSEKPEPWVCSKCSYVNVDGRNLFCAMCGTKNENRILEELNRISQQEEILLSSGSTDSMDSVSEDGLVDHDVRLLSTNPGGEDDARNVERPLGVPALNISGQRPGMEDDDADDEAQPLKPSTGRTAYLSHQENVFSGVAVRPSASQTDDVSVMNGSVCSSVMTVASMSSAMASSVASSTAMGGSVASSTATPRISNRGRMVPAKVSSNSHHQSDASIASSTLTEKATNNGHVQSDASVASSTLTEKATNNGHVQSDASVASSAVTETVTNNGHIQSEASVASSAVTEKTSNTRPLSVVNSEMLRSIPSNPAISFPRTVKSGIYSIDEEHNAFLPPSMRALSMPVRPQESDAYSTMSEPKKPIRTKDSDFAGIQGVKLESKPISVVRKESESSNYTENTARTSVVSSFYDEGSPKADKSPSTTVPRATVLPLHHNERRGRDSEDGRGSDIEQERRVAIKLFFACSLVVLISIILMVALVPTNSQNGDFNLPSFAFTNPPTPPQMIVGDSTANVVNSPIPSLSPTQSPTGFPATTAPTVEDGAILLGRLEGVVDSRRIGYSVSLGGIDGDAVAFVGVGAFGISKFDSGNGSWSPIETINSLESDILETAKISVATEMDRLALGYNGKLEVHEYSESNVKWIRRLVLNDGLTGSETSQTVLSMSGNGMFVAFLQPDLGLQMIDVRTWTRYPVSTAPGVEILQVELSLNGKMLAVLTENGVELKVPDPSDIWVDLVEPITDVKRATAIALSGNGEALAITSRTHTVLYSLNTKEDETLSTFTIAQGGIELSMDYNGHLLAIGRSNDMLNADETFNTVSLYRRATWDPLSPFDFGFVEDIRLGDAPGASLSLLTTNNVVENNTKIAVGTPQDGRKQQGSVQLYQVQHFSIK